VKYFKDVLGKGGQVHVCNSDDKTVAFHYADKSVISPLIYDDNYIPFLLNYCKENKIDIFVRRNIEGVRNSDKHIIIFFVDNNAYIGNGKIRDLDNRVWSIRDKDTIDYYFNTEDDDEEYADCDDRVKNSLDEFYNKMKAEIEGYKNLIKLTEDKYINIITSILSQKDTKQDVSVERILTEEALIIPNAETIKETLTENRQSFLYRSKH
jgi:hypothetical protein